MKKLLILMISFLGIFSACERDPITPNPHTPIALYGIRTAVYEPKAAADAVVAAEGKRESAAVEENHGLDE